MLSDLSAQNRSLKEGPDSNSRGGQAHQDDAVSPGENVGIGSAATSPANIQQQGGGSPLQQAQRLMEGYRNMQRPSIQAGIDQFQTHHDPSSHTPQEQGGYDSSYPHNGQFMGVSTTINGSHGVDQSGHHMFPGMGQTYNNNGQSGQVSWHETPPPPQGSGANSGIGTPGRPAPTRKRSAPNTPHWKRQPRVLLVEDDPTCRRIGSKFLSSAQCLVDVAVSIEFCVLWKGLIFCRTTV